VRVLSIVSGRLFGGVERLLCDLARFHHLTCPDLELEFALCFDEQCSQELRSHGVAVHLLGATHLRSPISVWRARRKLATLLDATHYDSIVFHMSWPLVIFGAVVAKEIPNVLWLHGVVTGNWLERLAALHPPSAVIANSDFTARSAQLLYASRPISVLYPPIPGGDHAHAAERAKIRSEFGLQPTDVVVLHASRMEEGKGLHVLLQALAQIANMPDWRALIAGGAQRPSEGKLERELRAVAIAGGISDRVQFLGQRNDVGRLLSAADIFVHANTVPEGFGQVFIEALHAGLPVVSTNHGGAAEILADGILVAPGSVEELAHVLARLVGNPAERATYHERGPRRAEELCSVERQIRQLKNIVAGAMIGFRC
jgi:glycosyltransferase involved in cell wall biosynthesis